LFGHKAGDGNNQHLEAIDMHIPDGILSPMVLGSAGAVSATVLGVAVKKVKNKLEHSEVPTMGVMAAFIFAAQMVNFPLLGAAASGHLLGGALASILFGFWPASIIMTTVVAIQAFLFQDGGITALGVNILNMAILAPLVASSVYKLLTNLKFSRTGSIFLSAWISVMATALFAALQLGASGVVEYPMAIKTLLFWHAFIGIGEGLITTAVMPFVSRFSLGMRKGEAMK
jgi:cobalt/nickel transport system permease protein